MLSMWSCVIPSAIAITEDGPLNEAALAEERGAIDLSMAVTEVG